MNKHLLKYLAFYIIAILFNSCGDSENKLLEPKVYFENKEYKLEVADQQESMSYDLQARVSSMCSSPVDVSYAVADASVVEEYNKKNGTDYGTFNASNVTFSSEVATIPGGEVYADKTPLKLSNLGDIEEGKPSLLPIRIKSSSLPIIEGTDVVYIIISKPVRIMKACSFSSTHVKVPLPPKSPFKSVTYEALIYINRLNSINTIMGCEGILMLRIGDEALPGKANDLIQIAGTKNYYAPQKFGTKKWYHVAFTYDQPSGKTVLYINGEKAAESSWDTPTFDLVGDGGGFFIAKIAGFMWGERPFNGYMSEVRLWNVARTENQIKQNMLMVDPKTDGLAFYYKLNGTDQYQEGTTWYIKDASGHNMNGLANGTASGGSRALNFVDLDAPVSIK